MDQCEKCPTVLIEDVPTTQDSFKGSGKGAHERVAGAIADLLCDEPGGKVIGLEGKWGAGKSSVVNLVRQQCEKDNFAFIQFDAWAHEGDPLRRTYLETVIQALQKKKWVGEDAWNEVLEKVAKRISTQKRKIIPKVSALGTCFAISVLFTPLGISLLSSNPNNAIYKDISDWWQIRLGVFGLAIVLAPLMVLAGNFLRLMWKRHIQKKPKESHDWALFNANALMEEQSYSIQTPEPTSIEFEQYFAELMTEALQEHSERRVLLVLDNLDRVEPKTALEIWSTLQAFVQEYHHRKKPWFSRLWVLVPYDQEGLKRMWESSSSGGNGQIAESFFDKSFQIRFQVPPPTLSNWKKYLCDLLQKALPKHDDKDQHSVYTIYNLFREPKSQPPTPRQLKLFVNQIGSIHRQWQDQYPLGDVAYYVLNANRPNLLGELQTGGIPKAEAKAILGDSLTKNMAGLAFNVEAELGQELLLADPIHNALVNCEVDALSKLESAHQEGFWAVLENVIADKVSSTAPTELSKTIRCLSKAGFFDKGPQQEINSIKWRLSNLARAAEAWTPLTEEMAEGINIICDVRNEETFSQKVYAAVIAPLTKAQVKPQDVQTISKGLLSFLGNMEHLGHLVNLDSTKLDMGAEEWFALCQSLAENENQAIAEKILSTAKIEDIQSLLQNSVNEGRFSAQHLNAVYITPQTAYKNKWGDLISTIGAKLNASGINAGEAALLLEAILKIEKIGAGKARPEITRLVNEGHLLHHLETARVENNNHLRTLILFAYLREKPDAGMSGVSGSADAGFAELKRIIEAADKVLAKAFLDEIAGWGDMSIFSPISEKVGYKPFIIECLRHIAVSKAPETIFTPETMVNEWSALNKHLGDDFNKLLSKLSVNPALYIKIKEDGFYFSDPAFYIALASYQTAETPAFIDWLIAEIQGIEKDDWVKCLTKTPDIFDLIFWLSQHNKPVTLDTAFSDALRVHATQIMAGTKTAADKYVESWDDILAFIKRPIRIELASHLLDAALDAKGKIDQRFLAMYENEVFNKDTLASNLKVVSHLFSPLLEARGAHGLNWMNAFFEKHPDFLKNAGDEATVEAFKNRLSRAITENPENEVQTAINEIARTLGVEPPIPEVVEAPEEEQGETETADSK